MTLEDTSGRNVVSHYGERTTDMKYGGGLTKKGLVKELALTFDYDDLPTGANADLSAQLPANASIISARFEVITAFTSTSTTTDLIVGVTDADGGSNITDDNGLLLATELTQTTIQVEGAIYSGAGAMVGFTIGAEAGVVTVGSSDTDLLTGKGRVIVEYLHQGA